MNFVQWACGQNNLPDEYTKMFILKLLHRTKNP